MAIMDPLIRGIDRILIHAQDVERVFARFRHEFGLPVAWPLADCGLLVSGGLYAGNMTIEIGRFTGSELPGTWFYGLGFAPWKPTWETVKGLASRRVSHAPPLTLNYESPVVMQSTLTVLRNLLDGQPSAPFWLGPSGGDKTRVGRALTNLRTWMAGTEAGSKTFSMLLGSSLVFLCDNHSNPHQGRINELRTTWREVRQHGPYGITGVAGVDIEVSTNLAGWRQLLDRPDLNTDSVHSFGKGSLLRFHPGAGNRLLGIEFACADLPSITQQRALVPIDEKRVALAPGRMDGLTIGFSQSPSAPPDKG
ncbi:MAG: hypothetical protein A4C66_00280 [Nitrospira sp. HN-bin3]|jgi:hypothetical protein|uniref:hypothetical protein n=1 Tax=Nitrospira cf. moscoviensis SBR1015 TaxID=96242 RepID=UPI000A09706E|nr:hypothetical protein [Nitrospira cf. moscoviensis SBR1015]MBH0207817.1 hypothetical protein [Nitrospira sp.]OQW42712.1 MAG: hypothetical protein A4C66_00280 [Nitrospira sp. HN-bin3]